MDRRNFLIGGAALLAGCNSQSNPTASLPPGWNIVFSPNMPAQMARNPADGSFYFDFPQSDGVHYVVKPASPVALGHTITMRYAIVGAGKLIATDGGTPAHVRIMIQQQGDDLATPDARWWSTYDALTAPGEFTLTALLHYAGWITIGGGLPSAGPAGFENCLAKIGNIGFTFGGWSAGHGVYAAGPSRFILRSFTVA